MSVPTTISQLNVTASLNSPIPSEPIGNNLSAYLNAHAAFIAQIANGTGMTNTVNLNMHSLQINNLANGTLGTDACNIAQMNAFLPYGAIVLWAGSVANIPAAFGSKWALCNGANGTPNLVDRFVIAAGNAYAPGAAGGTTSYALSIANMPVHNHGIYDPGHAHGVADPSHTHGVYDLGHSHGSGGSGFVIAGGANNVNNDYNGPNNAQIVGTTGTSAVGISLYGAGTGIGIYGAATGIQTNNAGSGAAFTVIPPYYALCYVMKIV
jgi:hypothetical protein